MNHSVLKSSNCRIWIFWHFPSIFVLLIETSLATLFHRKLGVFINSPKLTIFGIFNKLSLSKITKPSKKCLERKMNKNYLNFCAKVFFSPDTVLLQFEELFGAFLCCLSSNLSLFLSSSFSVYELYSWKKTWHTML